MPDPAPRFAALLAAVLIATAAGAPAAAQETTPAAGPAGPGGIAGGEGDMTAEDLTLRRVMLSTGGVGYFEYEATVSGDATLTLDVRLDQVDDVLKSIVVYDDTGRVGGISLPGREPLRDVFRELPFGPDALASPVALLRALRGAEVTSVGPRTVSGRVVAVADEQTRLPGDAGVITRHRVTLMTPEGLRQFVLEEADTVRFSDPRLQAQIDRALGALAELGERDRRRLTVQAAGEGERTVRVAYVVEAPLWKTSYRLTLPPEGAADAAGLQGWAVLENLSGEDWEDVELVVASGYPVTFRQALYTAYYVDRPEVPVEVLGRILPRVDTGGVPAAMAAAPPPAPSMAPGRARVEEETGAIAGGLFGAIAAAEDGMAAPEPAPDLARVTAAESTDAATQVLFRLPEPVSVRSGHSVLVPIVSREVPIERLALYQPDTHPIHPLASVRLTNDGDSGLPPGLLTLYERNADATVAFVGDARLGTLPAGEERLVSHAVDQRVRIDREQANTETIAGGRIVDGVLQLTMTQRQATTYTIVGAANADRTVVVEHPRRRGWDLVEPPVDAGDVIARTETAYRIRVPVPAGETVTLTVALQRPRHERLQLTSLSTSQIEFYASADALSPALRDAVARLVQYQAAVADRERALQRLEAEKGEIERDQGRIRRNLDSVPRDSDLYERYLNTLAEQEDRLSRLGTRIEETRAALTEARRALLEYVRGLSL